MKRLRSIHSCSSHIATTGTTIPVPAGRSICATDYCSSSDFDSPAGQRRAGLFYCHGTQQNGPMKIHHG